MSGSESGLLIAVFLACAVESVEALTIVLAVGIERGWRSALLGAGAGLVVLGALVAILGPAIRSVPLGTLRVVVGALLLVYGLQWLRKAILRGAGRKALHDETALFAQYSADARGAAGTADADRERIDGYAFSAAAKAVLLEGLEVVFIVISFGSGAHDIGGAAIAAGAAAAAVAGVGIAVRAPLSRVPENTMKLAVGVLLCAFGIFWATEGAGAHWPGGDAALLVLVPGLAVLALGYTRALRRRAPVSA